MRSLESGCNDDINNKYTSRGSFIEVKKIYLSVLFVPQTETITAVVSTSEAKLRVIFTGCTHPYRLLALWRRADIPTVNTAPTFEVRW